MSQNKKVLQPQNARKQTIGKCEINKYKPESEIPRKRPVHRIGLEIHPCKIKNEIGWANMDLNIHVGDVGALTALRVIGDSYISEKVQRVLEYIVEKFPEATGAVYAAPSWLLYFLDPLNGTYPALRDQIYAHRGDSSTVKMRVRMEREDDYERNTLAIRIEVLEKGDPLLVPHKQVLTHSLANPKFTELPAREQLMWAISKAILFYIICSRITRKIRCKPCL